MFTKNLLHTLLLTTTLTSAVTSMDNPHLGLNFVDRSIDNAFHSTTGQENPSLLSVITKGADEFKNGLYNNVCNVSKWTGAAYNGDYAPLMGEIIEQLMISYVGEGVYYNAINKQTNGGDDLELLRALEMKVIDALFLAMQKRSDIYGVVDQTGQTVTIYNNKTKFSTMLQCMCVDYIPGGKIVTSLANNKVISDFIIDKNLEPFFLKKFNSTFIEMFKSLVGKDETLKGTSGEIFLRVLTKAYEVATTSKEVVIVKNGDESVFCNEMWKYIEPRIKHYIREALLNSIKQASHKILGAPEYYGNSAIRYLSCFGLPFIFYSNGLSLSLLGSGISLGVTNSSLPHLTKYLTAKFDPLLESLLYDAIPYSKSEYFIYSYRYDKNKLPLERDLYLGEFSSDELRQLEKDTSFTQAVYKIAQSYCPTFLNRAVNAVHDLLGSKVIAEVKISDQEIGERKGKALRRLLIIMKKPQHLLTKEDQEILSNVKENPTFDRINYRIESIKENKNNEKNMSNAKHIDFKDSHENFANGLPVCVFGLANHIMHEYDLSTDLGQLENVLLEQILELSIEKQDEIIKLLRCGQYNKSLEILFDYEQLNEVNGEVNLTKLLSQNNISIVNELSKLSSMDGVSIHEMQKLVLKNYNKIQKLISEQKNIKGTEEVKQDLKNLDVTVLLNNFRAQRDVCLSNKYTVMFNNSELRENAISIVETYKKDKKSNVGDFILVNEDDFSDVNVNKCFAVLEDTPAWKNFIAPLKPTDNKTMYEELSNLRARIYSNVKGFMKTISDERADWSPNLSKCLQPLVVKELSVKEDATSEQVVLAYFVTKYLAQEGQSLEKLTQNDIETVWEMIYSYRLELLNNKEFFKNYGSEVLDYVQVNCEKGQQAYSLDDIIEALKEKNKKIFNDLS